MAAFADFSEDARGREVAMRSGATAYGWEIPRIRVREVEIHHVDLDAGYTPDDWSPDFAARTLDQISPFFRDNRDCPVGVLAATDGDGRWEVAARGPTLAGPRSALVGWLTGRTSGDGLVLDPPASCPGHHAGADGWRHSLGGVSYDGHVSPGGPPPTRELAALTITKVSVGPMDNNAYLLECRATGELLLVDAADDAATLLGLVGDGRWPPSSPPTGTGTTGRHWARWSTPPAPARPPAATTPRASRSRPTSRSPTATRVRVGEVALEVIHLVGHTPGSVALLYEDPAGHPHLFTGDSLFPGGVGRTTSPEDFASLIDDVETKVFGRLPDDTWFYPGHGNDSTLGAERPRAARVARPRLVTVSGRRALGACRAGRSARVSLSVPPQLSQRPVTAASSRSLAPRSPRAISSGRAER